MTNRETADTSNPAMRADGSAMVEPEERERRLLALAEALLDGRSHRWLVQQAIQTWSVSRRTAQAYVQEAEERLHADAQHLPPLFALELSQMQRNRFLRGLLERAGRGEELGPRDYCTLVATANRLLDSRDKSAARVLDQQARHKAAQETALVNEVKGQMRELAERDQAAREEWEARTKPGAPAPPDPPGPTSTPSPKADDGNPEGLDEEEYDWPLDEDGDAAMSLFSEEEKEELRKLDKELDEIERDPVRRAEMDRQVQRMIAGLPPYPRPGEADSPLPAGARGAEPPPSPALDSRTDPRCNAMGHNDLRADRQRRRQERKRLRRLRKRMRGRG